MAQINLLPWREELRKKRRRDFGVAVGLSVVLFCIGMLGVHFFIQSMIDRQVARNDYLKREIAALNKVIQEISQLEKTKAQLIARMDIIQQLQESRPEIVHLFDEVVESLPQGVFLTQLRQSGKSLAFWGRAESNARVSAYMRNVEGSAWMGRPDLRVIENKEKTDTGLSHFELRAAQVAKGEGAGR